MAHNPSNDPNLEKEISEEQFFSSSSSSSSYPCPSFSSFSPFSSEDDDSSKSRPTSDPTPTAEGVQGTPMQDQGGERSGGRAVVLATDGGAIVEATGVGAGVAGMGSLDKGKVQVAPPSGDQKMMRRKNVSGRPGASSSGGVEEKPRKKWTLSNPNKEIPQCRVCDKVFKSWHALYGHMNAHSNKNRARRVLRLPAPVSTPPGGVSPQRNNGARGNGDAGELVLNVAQEMQLGAAPPRPDGLIIDLNEPPPQEEEEGSDGDENKEGDNGAAK